MARMIDQASTQEKFPGEGDVRQRVLEFLADHGPSTSVPMPFSEGEVITIWQDDDGWRVEHQLTDEKTGVSITDEYYSDSEDDQLKLVTTAEQPGDSAPDRLDKIRIVRLMGLVDEADQILNEL